MIKTIDTEYFDEKIQAATEQLVSRTQDKLSNDV